MKMGNNNRGFKGLLKHSAVLTAITLGLGTATTARATLVFDDVSNYENGVTGAAATTNSSNPNTFMGDGYTLLSGTKDITGFDVYPTNLSGNNYTGLQITIYVWGTINTGTVNAANPAFKNLLGTYTFIRAGTFNTGSNYSVESATPGVTPGFALATPLTLPGTTVGLTFNYQGTTDGTTYASANNLNTPITYGTAPTVGSEPIDGYFRNVNSNTDGNFTSNPRSTGFANQGLAVRVYGDVGAVPEPSSEALMGAGGLALLVVTQRLRRRAQS